MFGLTSGLAIFLIVCILENERRQIKEYTFDKKDNILTAPIQRKF